MEIDPSVIAARYDSLNDKALLELAEHFSELSDVAQSLMQKELAARNLTLPEQPIAQPAEPKFTLRHPVTIRAYRDLSEAIVARTVLESAGIYVHLFNEEMVRIDWQLSNYLGGIQLQVNEFDVPEAELLLAQASPENITETKFTQPHCPKCGSADITFNGAERGLQIFALFFLRIPLPPGRKTWLCNSCKARWEIIDEGTSAS